MEYEDFIVGDIYVATQDMDIPATYWKAVTGSYVVPEGTEMRVVDLDGMYNDDATDYMSVGFEFMHEGKFIKNQNGTKDLFWWCNEYEDWDKIQKVV